MNVRDALIARFQPPEWGLFFEVGDRGGFMSSRRADAIAVSTYESKGYEIVGIEIKLQRSDWLRELNNPTKAEDMAKFCDRWYVATCDGVIAGRDEVPKAWGWIKTTPNGHRIVKRAQQLRSGGRRDLEPIPRAFFATLMRRCIEQKVDQAGIAKARQQERWAAEQHYKEKLDRYREMTDKRVAEKTADLRAKLSALHRLEQETNISLEEWRHKDSVALVQLALSLQRRHLPEDILSAARLLNDAGEALERLREEVEKCG